MTVPVEQLRGTLARVDLFSALDERALEALSRRATTRRLAPGERLMRQGQAGHEFYVVLSGSLQLSVRPDADADPLVVAILGPGQHVGEMALIDELPRSASADALEDTDLLVLARDDFSELVRSHPELALGLLRGMARRLRQTNADAAAIAHLDVYQRLVLKLVQLAEQQGVKSGRATLTVPAGPEVLGPMIGAESAGVKLLLELMEFEGLISRAGGGLTLCDLDRLRRSRGPVEFG